MIRSLWILMLAGAVVAGCEGSPRGELGDVEARAAVEQLYSCGMHPHVLEREPGSCPICGMDLVPTGERKIKYWVAPMDPSYISREPGKSPMGMDLVPVYEGGEPGGSTVISIDPAMVQNMGVRIEPVMLQTVFRHVRTIGEVVVGEDEISVVNLRFSGWVERIHVDRTGDPVRKGQPLFEIYSPDLVAAQEEYLLALRTQGAKSALTRSALRKLAFWDIAEEDIQAIRKARKARRLVTIRSPQSGFVLDKNIVQGARVKSGRDLYRIADLSRIWVTADVYEFDAPWVEVGQPAQMELPHAGGRVFQGRVAYIYPTLNDVSRTLTVRLEFENPDIRLKPGMFATVYIQYRRKDDVLAVPSEAILDSGRRKIVFVEIGDGRFEPREISTGLTGDHHETEVTSGLSQGERVVTSGQFLLDSESQLQEAIRKLLDRGKQEAEGATPAAPTLYACPMHPEVTSHEPGRCSECGMFLEREGTAP